MSPVRLGAVEYLNARPLVYGLDRQAGTFSLRFDVPSRCAALLHAHDVDLGIIPSIEFLRGGPYRVVPGVAIGSIGPIASVALFTTRPLADIRTIALDTSSRTSVALLRVLCAQHFRMAPEMRPMLPDPEHMLRECDAALIIGDRALMFDHVEAGVDKVDLGTAWTEYSGLPFVYAYWVGHQNAIGAVEIDALIAAGRDGAAHPDEVARAYFAATPAWVERGAQYLRDNVKFGFGEQQLEGLTRFYREAHQLGLVPEFRAPQFY
ncbi:MAG: menaquinone biosynthesis protein [Acidobacteriota bacterium]